VLFQRSSCLAWKCLRKIATHHLNLVCYLRMCWNIVLGTYLCRHTSEEFFELIILFLAVQQLFNFLPFYCIWSCLFEPIPFRVMIIFLTVPLITTLLFYFSQEAGQRTFWWLLIKFIHLNFIKLFKSFWRSVTRFLSPPLSLALSVFLSLSQCFVGPFVPDRTPKCNPKMMMQFLRFAKCWMGTWICQLPSLILKFGLLCTIQRYSLLGLHL